MTVAAAAGAAAAAALLLLLLLSSSGVHQGSRDPQCPLWGWQARWDLPWWGCNYCIGICKLSNTQPKHVQQRRLQRHNLASCLDPCLADGAI